MDLRFISWNIHGKTPASHLFDLLQTNAGDLVALQEVTIPAYQALVESKLFAWSAFSLDRRPPRLNEGQGRRLGCAVFGQAPFQLKQSSLLEHAPPGVNWGEKKPLALLALARWLSEHQTRTLVGMDANAPKTDHPDIEQNEWWWEEEPLMLGPRPLHVLKDALRLWLAAHPAEAARRCMLRPQGPLAVSFDRGKGGSVPCRYDFIYVTPDFTVSQILYPYEEAIKAGSDHAAVIADLSYVQLDIK